MIGRSEELGRRTWPWFAPGLRRRIPLGFAARCCVSATMDIVALSGATLCAFAFAGSSRLSVSGTPYWFVVATWPLVGAALGAFEPSALVSPRLARDGLVLGPVLIGVISVMAGALAPDVPLSLPPVLIVALLAPAAVGVLRILGLHVLRRPRFRQRVLLSGASHSEETAALALIGHAFDVVRSSATDPASLGAVATEGIGSAIVGPDATTALAACVGDGRSDLKIVSVDAWLELVTGKVALADVGHGGLGVKDGLRRSIYLTVKRAIDLVVGMVGLILVGGALPIVAAAIYFDSPGPIFHRQTRVGTNSALFTVYKFRTMVPDAEPGGAVWATDGDPRITRIGRILRASHFDEFPQFLNIVRGQMSLIGPRPERPEFVTLLEEVNPLYALRHSVKPGMGGWALVRQGYGSSVEDALEKLGYDFYYIRHQSLWLDSVIAIRTLLHAGSMSGR